MKLYCNLPQNKTKDPSIDKKEKEFLRVGEIVPESFKVAAGGARAGWTGNNFQRPRV